MSAQPHNSLFPDVTPAVPVVQGSVLHPASALHPGSALPVPQGSALRGPRGWAALPIRLHIVELDDANAAGRHKLTFRYRPLKTWTADRLEIVETLLLDYFRVFGGFRIADQAILRAWVEALDVFTEQEIRAALNAKYASLQAATPEERAAKAHFRVAPENFPAKVGYWLSPSELAQERRRILDRAAASGARTLDQLAPRPVLAPDAAVAWWAALPEGKRAAALEAVRSRLIERAHTWHLAESSPELADLHRTWAIDWALRMWPPPVLQGSALQLSTSALEHRKEPRNVAHQTTSEKGRPTDAEADLRGHEARGAGMAGDKHPRGE